MAIGIDPGKSGYLALVGEGRVIEVLPTPTLRVGKKTGKRDYNVRGMVDAVVYLSGTAPGQPPVVLEKQQPMPGQGVTSMFNVGRGYGLWEGIIAWLNSRYHIVHPRTWQKVMHRDVQGDDTKTRSILACQRMFPEHSLLRTPRCRKPDDNMADAILLAAWGIREFGQSQPIQPTPACHTNHDYELSPDELREARAPKEDHQ